MSNIISRDEIRRLEKAAREKDKKKLLDWLQQYQYYMDSLLRREYDKAYQDEVASTIENTLTAVAYTAYFSEENYVDNENIGDYMADLFATLDMYRTGEYTPQEYKDILKENGVTLDEYDYDGPYKKFLHMTDTDLVRYLRSNHKKIITICGSSKFKDDILKINAELTLQNYITFVDGVSLQLGVVDTLEEDKKQLENLHKEKILISDAIYVVNKDGYIGESTKTYIEYAKEHNKEIIYMEEIKE